MFNLLKMRALLRENSGINATHLFFLFGRKDEGFGGPGRLTHTERQTGIEPYIEEGLSSLSAKYLSANLIVIGLSFV